MYLDNFEFSFASLMLGSRTPGPKNPPFGCGTICIHLLWRLFDVCSSFVAFFCSKMVMIFSSSRWGSPIGDLPTEKCVSNLLPGSLLQRNFRLVGLGPGGLDFWDHPLMKFDCYLGSTPIRIPNYQPEAPIDH